ncbi:MAG TPA: hypothetical protein VNI55_01340 [Gaiellaceae bacterium]|nr:hypothetical protein [Gaiellaceae bacterium]
MALRLTGFLLVLALLGLSGYAALEKGRNGTLNPAKGVSEAEQRAELASAEYVLGIVASQLEQIRTLSGTYDNDLDLSTFPLVRLASANETSYCLEFEKTATFFRPGPGGSTAVGTC